MNFLKRHKRQINSAALLAHEITPLLGGFPLCFSLADWRPPLFVWVLLYTVAIFSGVLQVLSNLLYVPPLPIETMLFLGGDVDFVDTRQYAG
jgi:hypothetical protein